MSDEKMNVAEKQVLDFLNDGDTGNEEIIAVKAYYEGLKTGMQIASNKEKETA